MVVRYDIAIFINNKSGPQTPLLEFLLRPSSKEFLEEIVQLVIFLRRTSSELAMYSGASLSVPFRPYIDHCRAVFFSEIGKTLRCCPKIL